MNLFVWEAFVSKNSKTNTHYGDAEAAVKAFLKEYPNIVQANAFNEENPYNLAAASILRTGISNNINLLSEPCIVIKG